MKNKILIIVIILFGVFACNNGKDYNSTICNQMTIISSEQFANAPADQLSINSLEINGNCLKINFGSSGCSGDSWKLKLIDSEAILETAIPQRNLRLSLKNNEDCLAYFIREISFDISQLQVNGNKVILNITNSENQILYEY